MYKRNQTTTNLETAVLTIPSLSFQKFHTNPHQSRPSHLYTKYHTDTFIVCIRACGQWVSTYWVADTNKLTWSAAPNIQWVMEAKPTIFRGTSYRTHINHEFMDKVTDSSNHLVKYIVSDCPHNRDAYNVYQKIGLFCEMKFQKMPKNFTHIVMAKKFLESY